MENTALHNLLSTLIISNQSHIWYELSLTTLFRCLFLESSRWLTLGFVPLYASLLLGKLPAPSPGLNGGLPGDSLNAIRPTYTSDYASLGLPFDRVNIMTNTVYKY